MKKILRARNVVLALIVSVLVGTAQFVYRTNNFCEPGDHPIRSEEGAIAVAKKRWSRIRFSVPSASEVRQILLLPWRRRKIAVTHSASQHSGFDFLGRSSWRKHFSLSFWHVLAAIEKCEEPYRPCRNVELRRDFHFCFLQRCRLLEANVMSGNEVKLTNGDRWTWQQFLDHYYEPSASGAPVPVAGRPLPWNVSDHR
jgi:hypothetical protein